MLLVFLLLCILPSTLASKQQEYYKKWNTHRPLGFHFLPDTNPLPILVLPNATYRASQHDSKNDIYLFTNIRFAAPPIGALRWEKPQPPPIMAMEQDGSEGASCIHSLPTRFLVFKPVVQTPFKQSEDCLFLDLYIPGDVVRGFVKELAILHWLYGGGYVFGTKDMWKGWTFLKSSNNSIIFAASNYRLGAFGWMGGTAFMEQGGVPNAGFYDQLQAMRWIEEHAEIFGGDAKNVTIMGESAGASSIMHHLTGYGGKHEVPFQRAMLFSPAFFPQYDPLGLNQQYTDFAQEAGCDLSPGTLKCLKSIPSQILTEAQQKQTGRSEWGKFTWGPTVDGNYVPDLPGRLFLEGKYIKNISILQGHTAAEATIFTPPELTTATDRVALNLIRHNFPLASEWELGKIAALYPSPEKSNDRYKTQWERIDKLIGDWIFNCNIKYITKAYGDKTFNYRYNMGPTWHSMDLFLTFVDMDVTFLGHEFNVHLPHSDEWHSYLVSFVKYGDPNREREPNTPAWYYAGKGMQYVELTWDGIKAEKKDEQIDERMCSFWQRAGYSSIRWQYNFDKVVNGMRNAESKEYAD